MVVLALCCYMAFPVVDEKGSLLLQGESYCSGLSHCRAKALGLQ